MTPNDEHTTTTEEQASPTMTFAELDEVLLSLDSDAGSAPGAAGAPDDLDMSWVGEVEPPKRDPKFDLLMQAMKEFQAAPPDIYVRTVSAEGFKYALIGTWTGRKNDKTVRINAAPGKFKSLVAALDGLVLLDLREEHPEGEHRVWLLPHQVDLPLKVWLSVGGENRAIKFFALTEDGHRQIDDSEYRRRRGACT